MSEESLLDIAVLAAAGRFPGAADLDQFWTNLKQGVESVRSFSHQEMLDAGVDPEQLADPNFVAAHGVLDDVDRFDAEFFGFTPREAALLDPQQRILLELGWNALEQAGYGDAGDRGRVGVFAGAGRSGYEARARAASHSGEDEGDTGDELSVSLGNASDFLPLWLSYKLDLRGPSVNVQTSCSTGLAAIHLACQSLLQRECDLALAGGISVAVPQQAGYRYQEGSILSPDGHCRPFDQDARGTVGGSGAGLVVLKRLGEALEDGDPILALIKGSAMNNDGAGKIGFTAPSIEGQAEVIAEALAVAGVDASTIDYIEAHGTGTPLGDPIEIAALRQAFEQQSSEGTTLPLGSCALGSVKSNVGHLDRAAGIAGFLKALLALHHGELPPTLHFTEPNPQLRLAETPFHVQAEITPWNSCNGTADPRVRRAGISSFGMGGTNVHVIVEEAPRAEPASVPTPAESPQLLVLSARTAAALERRCQDLDAHLQRHPDLALADVARTLQRGRRRFEHRAVLVACDVEQARQALTSEASESWMLHGPSGSHLLHTRRDEQQHREVAFLFPGQGAQHPGLGKDLLGHSEYKEQLRVCAEHLREDLRPLLPAYDGDLLRLLEDGETDSDLLARTEITQPLLFSVEYALARQWMAWGVQPVAMLGHSVGEYVAACLAGVFSLETALHLVTLRGRLMAALPTGAMLTVPLPEEELAPYLAQTEGRVELAAVNSPGACVASGTSEGVDALQRQLEADGLECRRLQTSHAFHSAMMEPILDSFRDTVAQVELQAPQKRFLSNLSGTWIRDEEAVDPDYWTRHLRSTVRFADGLSELLRDPELLLLEVGPGRTLATLARQVPLGAEAPERLLVTSMPTPKEAPERDGRDVLLHALGELWLAGVDVNWRAFRQNDSGGQGSHRRVTLPGYPFADQRHWIDIQPTDGKLQVTSTASAQVVPEKQADPAHWFYLPVLQETPPRIPGTVDTSEVDSWLLLADPARAQEVAQLRTTLQEQDTAWVHVEFATEAQDLNVTGSLAGDAKVGPVRRSDFSSLVQQLHAADRLPKHILYLPAVPVEAHEAGSHEALGSSRAADAIRLYYPLVYLAQALSETGELDGVRIGVLVDGVLRLHEAEPVSPLLATLMAPCLVLPQELAGLRCLLLDAPTETATSKAWAGKILDEVRAPVADDGILAAVALRGHRRWQADFSAIPLPASPGLSATNLRPGGTYMITDGVGSLGSMLARALVDTVTAEGGEAPRLALLTPGEFPPPAEWERILGASEETPLRTAVEQLQALVDRGVQLLVLRASSSDAAALQGALDQVHERFGPIHGAFHTEHSPGAGLVALRSADTAIEVLRARTTGMDNLADALEALQSGTQGEDSVELIVLCSSIAGIMGGFGLLDHAASACYLDASSATLSGRFPQARVLTLDWGPSHWEDWQEALITAAPELREQLRQSRLSYGLSVEEGAEVLRRGLASGLPHLIVSTQDLRAAIRNQLSLGQMQNQTNAAGQLGTGSSREHVAPRDEVEEQVADVWLELFGVPRIGIHDDFFEIGGHSLLAIQVVSRLRKRLQVELPMPILFEAPTVAQLADHVRQQQGQQESLAEVEAMLAEIEGLSLDEVRAELDTPEP